MKQVPEGIPEHQVKRVTEVIQDHKEREATLVRRAKTVLRVFKEFRDPLDHQAHQVSLLMNYPQKYRLYQAHRDHKVRRDYRDPKEKGDIQESQEHQDIRENLVCRESGVLLVMMG